MSILKIACVQQDIVFGNKDENLITTAHSLNRVARDTDLVVIPELFSTGFITDPDHMKAMAETNDGHTMDDYFDAVYLSYQLCELKPSEAIFRKMIAAGGMRPEETLFIDDGQKNVDAAQRLGFAVYMPGPGEDFGHILDLSLIHI